MAEHLVDILGGAGGSQKLAADGFAVLDANTGEILRWGPWVPMFLAKDARIPVPGHHLHFSTGRLYADVVQANDNRRLTAVSLVSVADLRWLGMARRPADGGRLEARRAACGVRRAACGDDGRDQRHDCKEGDGHDERHGVARLGAHKRVLPRASFVRS